MRCRMSNCVSWFQSRYNKTHLVLQLCRELSNRHLINVTLLRGARVMVLKAEVFHLTPQQTNHMHLQHTLSLSYTKSAAPTSGTQRFVMTLLCFPWEKTLQTGSGKKAQRMVHRQSQLTPKHVQYTSWFSTSVLYFLCPTPFLPYFFSLLWERV